MTLLAAATWSLRIGDPTVLGWSVFAGYLVAATLCRRAAVRSIGPAAVGARRFWWTLAIALVVLAANKQLDLQKLLTQLARDYAKEGGWYRERKPFQAAVVFGFLAVAGVTLLTLLFLLRRHLARLWPALLGMAIIALFIAMRAVSWHKAEEFLVAGALPARLWMEPVGIVAIVLAAALVPRPPRRPARSAVAQAKPNSGKA